MAIVRAIITKGNKYLLVRRAESVGSNLWQFPGGHSDGQGYKTAIRRETKEETNLTLHNLRPVADLHNPITNKRTIFFQSNKFSGKIKLQAEELNAAKWVGRNTRLPLTYSTKWFLRGRKS
jgi:ADP-ribose pyrophosphatase YjhB (NUDIX family)